MRRPRVDQVRHRQLMNMAKALNGARVNDAPLIAIQSYELMNRIPDLVQEFLQLLTVSTESTNVGESDVWKPGALEATHHEAWAESATSDIKAIMAHYRRKVNS